MKLISNHCFLDWKLRNFQSIFWSKCWYDFSIQKINKHPHNSEFQELKALLRYSRAPTECYTHIAQCFYTQSHAFMMKIPLTYYEAPTTNFRLFWDAEKWNFSNHKSNNPFRTLWLLLVLAPFFKVSIVKNQRFFSVANSQLVSNDFQLLKALSHLCLLWE